MMIGIVNHLVRLFIIDLSKVLDSLPQGILIAKLNT